MAATLRRHAVYLVDFYDGDEGRACRDIRKHIAWYLKGFPAGSTVRNRLALVDNIQALGALAVEFAYLDAEPDYDRMIQQQ